MTAVLIQIPIEDIEGEDTKTHEEDIVAVAAVQDQKDAENRKHKKYEDIMPKLGIIYKGLVRNVFDYGAFISLDGFHRKDGLCHVSEIKTEGRLRDANDMLRRGDKVFVKVIRMKDNKISLSMKEVEQVTGRDLNPKHTEELRTPMGENRSYKNYRGTRNINAVKPIIKEGKLFGGLTGIKIDDDNNQGPVKRLTSPDKWELSRLKAGHVIDKEDEMNIEGNLAENLDELDEDENEIELNEDHPPFLEFSKTKTGISLSPIKITK
jgi:ATP-dependent RNA helicase DHX8/PRP22